MNTKFLYFQDGSNNGYLYPVTNLVNMHENSATTVDLLFTSSLDPAVVANDSVRITVTSGKAKEVMQAIVEKINEVDGPRTDDFIVIADNTNQVYLTADITDVAETIGS
tara:strand:+ start:275 stop:601 length:327 start_codon:yes stop_codon:yes gene_type:complete